MATPLIRRESITLIIQPLFWGLIMHVRDHAWATSNHAVHHACLSVVRCHRMGNFCTVHHAWTITSSYKLNIKYK